MNDVQDDPRDKLTFIFLGGLSLCAVASIYNSFVPTPAMAKTATLTATGIALLVVMRVIKTRLWLRLYSVNRSSRPVVTKAMVVVAIAAPGVCAFLVGQSVVGNVLPWAITSMIGAQGRTVVMTSDASWFDVKRRECIKLKLVGRPDIMIGGRVMCGDQFKNTIVSQNTPFAFLGSMTPLGINVSHIQSVRDFSISEVPSSGDL